MKKIIIDSGSTKADIAIISGNDVEYIQQVGMNPSTQKSIFIGEELKSYIEEADQVFFYGAGVHDQSHRDIITEAFKHHNVGIEVIAESDLLAACRATAGKKKGIVSILGTGSNSCVYDGENIIANIPSMGFVLGDEGGGTYIGTSILKSFLNGEMPKKIAKKFKKDYLLEDAYLLRNIYVEDGANRFLAGHSAFLKDVKGKWKKRILNNAFTDFIEKRIKKYDGYEKYKLYFVGSIAYHYHKHLDRALEKQGLSIKSITRYPITELVKYHKKYHF